MTNPYEPPKGPCENRLAELMVPGTYFGGLWGVVTVGVLGGLGVGLVVYSELTSVWFIAPAIAWIGAFFALLLMLRGSEIQASTRILLPLLLAIPAYILYVPVCTFSAMFTTSFMGANGYGPTFPGLILSSVVAFVVILLLFASVLRRRFKQRVPASEPQVVAATQQADFSAPLDEPLDE